MAPSSDSALETIGEGGVGCRKADGPYVSGEGDGAAEPQERDVALGAFLLVAGVDKDLCHATGLCLGGEGVQLVGPQPHLIHILVMLPASRRKGWDRGPLCCLPHPHC